MSFSSSDISNSGGPGSAAEPSMEEILASIRRILKEDETRSEAEDEDVLLLDESMRVKPAELGSATMPPEPEAPPEEYPAMPVESYAGDVQFATEPAPPAWDYETVASAPEILPLAAEPEMPAVDYYPIAHEDSLQGEPETPETYLTETEMTEPASENIQPPHGILSGATADAAASSIGALVRSISQEKSIAISRGGITIEDIVREEIRPLLKSWLDTHLPSLVERVVRNEIERVVERSTL